MFADFLEICREGRLEDSDELIADLASALEEGRIDANGGAPDARRALAEIDRLLREALADGALKPAEMMATGKIFIDAGLPPPQCLKEALARVFSLLTEAPGAESQEDLGAVLGEDAFKVGDNPFDIYDHARSLTCILPDAAKIAIIGHLANDPLAAQAAAGFLLDPDDAVAIATAEALAEAAKKAPVESVALERLVLIRPWLEPARRPAVDAAIKAMRRNALPAEPAPAAKVVKCVATLCDGSGAMQFAMAQKVGTRFRIAAIMTKPAGVADAFVLDGLPKREMEAVLAQVKSAVPTRETDASTLARLLRIALGDNLTSKTPPPFQIVQAVEAMGLGQICPDCASPSEVIERLLADAPPASAKPEIQVAELDFVEGWFEGVADVESLLKPVKGRQRRIKKLLEAYLPGRRHFWARQCAMTALVLRAGRDRIDTAWPQLARAGRDIASDRPLAEIPLMTRVAEETVRAFEESL
ncbi:hypothetical protein K9U39_00100 [Rhodoblastus acidophilus]|uniref:DUF2336 domain-containing protein n=2 Tax=Candidatus Rhodoblastus alkanivorans TaxID=2954117 RepID=A0ABS9Z310_9HYPH|nr:hypothetical protein [Candidatus Rhodoblastus alkanivorans]MCI4682060.1 hypothetical protein [Candidatus Rhodoblastus alkanivorans]MDI4639362.1 hypothetical protein [Rhodoblastus acidophilus]